MWDISYLIKDFLRTRNFRKFINNQFKDDNKVILDKKFLKSLKIIETISGTKFIVDDMFLTLSDVENDYNIGDIRKTDIVLDIGACIGGFTLKVNKMVSKVYCIEPTMIDRLKKNIILNDAKNVVAIEAAIGDGITDISWGEYKNNVKAMCLSDIVTLLCGGHVDFLKIDCEGGEWFILPEELIGIRRIEAEIHNLDNKHNLKNFLKVLDEAGFEYTYNELKPKITMIVHAKNKFID